MSTNETIGHIPEKKESVLEEFKREHPNLGELYEGNFTSLVMSFVANREEYEVDADSAHNFLVKVLERIIDGIKEGSITKDNFDLKASDIIETLLSSEIKTLQDANKDPQRKAAAQARLEEFIRAIAPNLKPDWLK